MAKLNAAHADQVKHFQSQIDQINKENSDTHQSLIKTQAERDKKHREEIDDRNKQAEETARQYQLRLDTTVQQHESFVKHLNETNKREIETLTHKFEKQLQDEGTAQRQLLEKTKASHNDEMHQQAERNHQELTAKTTLYNKLLADMTEQNNNELKTLQSKYEQLIKDLNTDYS